MNVIIIHDNAMITGGAQKVAITEAVALSEQGYKVIYFAAVGPIDPALLNSNVKVEILGQNELKDALNGKYEKIKGALRGLYNREAYKKLNELLKKFDNKNTIVHIHGWSLALSPYIFKAIYENGFKVAITCHDYEINCPVRTYFNYKLNKMCDKNGMSLSCIMCNCDKRSYIQKVYRVIRERIFYRYARKCDLSLIYLSEFNKNIIEREKRLTTKGYIVPNLVEIPEYVNVNTKQNELYLFIGRLNPEKGCELFCEAITRANVKGIVIGEGIEYEKLRKQYTNIEFSGWKTAKEMSTIIPKCRCLIMSSIWYEGAPLTIPEIQGGYSLPCIVPTPSGAVDYICDEKNGLIFKSGDIDSLVNCIVKLKDDKFVEKLTINCKKEFDREKYTKNTHISRLVNVYEKILNFKYDL
jgi:glycosyltransferase involved in cell wall biosynthesis